MARILVVDDSPTARGAVCDAFEGCGHELIEYDDGGEAFEAALRLRPEIAIIDVVMERTNGYQLCRDLRRTDATRDVRVIMLTAKAGEADAKWGYSQGADVFLAKPFDPGALRQAVSELLAEGRG